MPEIDMQQAVADKIFENICEFLVDLRSESDNLRIPRKADRFHLRNRCSSLARQANLLQSTIVEVEFCPVPER
ncbi:MAG: hypothetical protein DMF01_03030 [Verrucomicrobia bacterium]|nr:MAG: hypothetical protein DMF01_03030 [Verrucomicrobiota bacterium]